MSSTSRPNQSDRKAAWVEHVRSLDPHGNQGDPETMTKEDLIDLAEELEAQAGTGPAADPGDAASDTNSETPEPAGTSDAGETRTAQRVGTGDTAQDPAAGAVSPDLGGYHTQTAGPAPARASHQRSETTSAVTDRPPQDAERMAADQTPATSERIMGLSDSPKAAETGQGH